VLFIEGFSEPMYMEGVSASLVGQFARRVSLSAIAAYSQGSFGGGRSRTDSHGGQTASTQLGVLLTRHLSLSGQYFYFRQRLGDNVVLPEGVPRNLNRHSVRVGLNLQVPLIS
jgi:hypothetical protein